MARKIAFVSNDRQAEPRFRVVTYSTAAGNGTPAGAPVAYPGTGSQTTALAFSSTTDTNSSLYVDYINDAAYVGDDGGKLYKISPVFGGGNPAVVWTATLAGKLTGPVLDSANNVVLVGSSNGDLYAVLSFNRHGQLTGSPGGLATGPRMGALSTRLS